MTRFFNKRNIIIAIIVGVIIAVVFSVIYAMDKLSGNYEAKENQKEIKAISKEVSDDTSEELKSVDYYDVSNIYDIMHRMTNSKIVAKDGQVWGKLSMDKKDIKALKETVSKIDYEDREYLLEVLTRWEEEDFSNCVDEHNYFWKKLGGTVGEAYKLKE